MIRLFCYAVIKSEDDVLLSGPWAPYPLDQVKHLDDNVDKYLGKMGDDQAAWMKVLQEVLKVRLHPIASECVAPCRMPGFLLAKAAVPVMHGVVPLSVPLRDDSGWLLS